MKEIPVNKYIEISTGNMKIFSMHFPYRKKIGLGIYLEDGNRYAKVATFNNEKSAELFMEYLAMFVGAEREEE